MLGSLSGLLLLGGRVFIAFAVAEGLAGPSQAIMSCNSAIITVLSILFDNQSLSEFELLGLISGLSGAAIIALGDNFKNAPKTAV